MLKVLILYNRLWPYRIPIFNILAEKYDLTVSYSLGADIDQPVNFKTLHLPGKHYSRFYLHKDSLLKVCNEYDVVVGYGDIGWLSLMSVLFRKRRFKIIFWGIGVRASYGHSYGEKTPWDRVRYFLMKKADALLFYSKDPISLYQSEGFKEEKLFVANNTVEVLEIKEKKSRDSLIFIGTLYKQKRIYELLNSYLEAFQLNKKLPVLNIIGHGDEYENINDWIQQHHLTDRIFLRGKIFDEEVLRDYFSQSIACISPGQAGLSVLKSMGYGVPFITKENAITGGEIFNIQHEVSGILYHEDKELTSIILDIAENPGKYIDMGEIAMKYYYDHRKPTDMAQGIIDAVTYVARKNK